MAAADQDPYNRPIGQEAPGTKQVAITPADGTDLASVVRALVINDDGPVTVAFVASNDSTARQWRGLMAGDIIPMFTKRVMSSGTSATNILGII